MIKNNQDYQSILILIMVQKIRLKIPSIFHWECTGENIELVRQVISNDLHSTYDEVIAETSLSLRTQ